MPKEANLNLFNFFWNI